MGTAISTSQLTKDYGEGRGVLDLTLDVTDGEVFGFLGPNGAGKTTTIRLLMGLVKPNGGSATVYGHDCWSDADSLKRLVGYLPGDIPAFGTLKGREVISFVAGMRRDVDFDYALSLADRFDLNLGLKFSQYSRGNRQKLGLILAFMHRPKLYILDEPTGGLDPINQKEFRDLVRDVVRKGATVFLSSHILSEVEEVCDHVGIIRSGKLVRVTKLSDLRAMQIHDIRIAFSKVPELAVFEEVPGLSDLSSTDHLVTFTLAGPIAPLLTKLASSDIEMIESNEPSLEEIFLSYYRDEKD